MKRSRLRASAALAAVLALVAACAPGGKTERALDERVEIDSGGWRIVGDLEVPDTTDARERPAAVILLNKAAGDRSAYVGLARQLARHGVASLRIDLRGHGESTNRGRFVPDSGTTILGGSAEDVAAALRFLREDGRVDPTRIGCVGASYSGEVMMEAARATQYAAAYVALSPGSLSDASIAAIDREHLPFLLVVSRHERWLKEVVQAVRDQSRESELWELEGTEHATDLLAAHEDLAELIAVWLRHRLAGGRRAAGIPSVVTDALTGRFPGAVIRKWTRETEEGRIVYDIEFERADEKLEMDVGEDGEVANWEREIDPGELPEVVVRAVEARYPRARTREAMAITEVRAGVDEPGGFEVLLETADGRVVEVTLAPDGTVLEDSGGEE